MARQIKIDQIADLMEEEVQTIVDVVAAELVAEVVQQTPVDTGRLRALWLLRKSKLQATVTNNVEYAEPVLYGNNLPPSWEGKHRTRQGTIPGFPDLICKEKATKRVPELIAAFRRRN